MKPSVAQRLFAKSWLWPITFWAGSLLAGFVVAVQFYPAKTHFVLALLIGATSGVALTSFGLRVIWRLRRRFNGAPFRSGDLVRILSGRHRGVVTTVYEEWPERDQVRVDLGEQAKRDVQDVFSCVELIREKNI